MSWRSCCRRPLRILNSRRAKTSRYSARIAWLMYSLAGRVIASTSTVRCSPSGVRAAETRIFVSMTSRSGIIWSAGHLKYQSSLHKSTTLRSLRPAGFASGFDDPINLARAQRARALAPRLVSDEPEHFRLRGGKSHVVPDAQQHRLRSTALLNDKRPAFVRYPAQKLAKIGTGVQG